MKKTILVLHLFELLAIAAVLTVSSAKISHLEARIALFEKQHVYIQFHARELEASNNKMQCQVDIAVAGFRGGHSVAYRLYTEGAFESCERVSGTEVASVSHPLGAYPLESDSHPAD